MWAEFAPRPVEWPLRIAFGAIACLCLYFEPHLMRSRYADQSAYEAHSKTADFQNMIKAVTEEGLLSAPLVIKYLKPIGGFESRL